ncbi:triose-phosphate isomerase [Sphingomonas sp. BN140010]|uniref:Triosephosphate isomerase n=1 Tax=Sphingomonas arvum TaxID=2992113 RepID=A0ABT3JI75_9SPHN|nr:triose-phosphate isomerase [Sphingomonas sp. BN140010]MCW3798787.1 triose-phosphate isomerase [Sphingomonas sp. BN140010]
MTRRKLVAGNWKMHGTSADLTEVRAVAEAAAQLGERVDVALCLPATLIHRAAEAVPGFAIGAQDIHMADRGAHTGDVCAAMLHDAGATLTIVGHSERRDAHREDDAAVRAKAEAGLRSGLKVILCVGESDAERESGRAVDVVTGQLRASLPQVHVTTATFAVAYEPIWAIGTGKVPSTADIAEMHGALRRTLVESLGGEGNGVRILYGGSVKGSNAAEIFAVPDVDGALVGGASLKAMDFLPIVEAAASVE